MSQGYFLVRQYNLTTRAKCNVQAILKMFLIDGYIKENQSPDGNFALVSLRTRRYSSCSFSTFIFERETN